MDYPSHLRQLARYLYVAVVDKKTSARNFYTNVHSGSFCINAVRWNSGQKVDIKKKLKTTFQIVILETWY